MTLIDLSLSSSPLPPHLLRLTFLLVSPPSLAGPTHSPRPRTPWDNWTIAQQLDTDWVTSQAHSAFPQAVHQTALVLALPSAGQKQPYEDPLPLPDIQSWGRGWRSHRGPCSVSPTTCGRGELLKHGWEGRDGKQVCATHRKGPGLFSQPLRRDRAGLVGLGEVLDSRANSYNPTAQLIGNGNSSLRVGLCCPPLCSPPLFAGNAESRGWSPVWSLALGLEAQPCHLCVSQDLQTDWSLVRLCGAALASESPWDRKEKTPMPDPT